METGFSLGSNIGDRLGWLRQAKEQLLSVQDVTLVAQSSAYETEPVDVKDECRGMKFLNAVLIVESPHRAEEWLPRIHEVEYTLQRKRSEDRNAPRTIDIDLLFSGDQILDSDLLRVPHPRWAERRFVLEPLAEVRGDFIMPGTDSSVRDVLAKLPSNDDVQVFAGEW